MRFYHSSLASDITSFRGNSHFAHQIEPSLFVAARVYFGDQARLDDATFFAMIPKLYTCKSDIEISKFAEFHDIGTPDIGNAGYHWAKRYQDADIEKYRKLVPFFASERTPDEEKLERLRQDMAEQNIVGYQYENKFEGGTAVCFMDASSVTVEMSEPIDRAEIAMIFLKMSFEETEVVNDRLYLIAMRRAMFFL